MSPQVTKLERLSTGVPGLDRILDGGLVRGGVHLLQGVPGAGKTVLSNQMCFAHVAAGGRALYTTLLAETSAHMMQHISTLSFFDASAVPAALSYISAYSAMKTALKDVVKLLSSELRSKKPALLIIDGLAIANVSFGPVEVKEFIHELQLAGEAYGCTTLILSTGAQGSYQPELTMVDGIITLQRTLHGTRSLREVEVQKMRGSNAVFGRHSMVITGSGVTVYPRLEALLGDPNAVPAPAGQPLGTGVPRLDRMLGGGLPPSSTTMRLGPSGSGKTTIGLHFLAQSTVEEPGLLLGFYEGPSRLARKAKDLGLPFQELVDAGALTLMCFPPTEQILDDLGARLLETLHKQKTMRLFIDGLDGFELATPDRHRVIPFFTALANELRIMGVTTLFTSETPQTIGMKIEVPFAGTSGLAENIILLHWLQSRARLHRLLSITKVRDSEFDLSVHEYSITGQGIVVAEDSTGARALLSGESADVDGGGP
jgi:circadian clock protein KaiC